MGPYVIAGLAAIVILASFWRQARLSAELKVSRARIAALEVHANQRAMEFAAMERTVRFERAVCKTFATDVGCYLHKCRHDLASTLNVATGFLELVAQALNSHEAGSGRTEQIRRAQIALDKACKLTVQMPLSAPELPVNGGRRHLDNGQPQATGHPIGVARRG